MLILSLILLLYALFILWNWLGIALSSSFAKVPQGKKGSIIIPFHNEENNISQLWESLLKLNGLSSNVELIFVNDHSNDSGVEKLLELIKSQPVVCSVKIIDSPFRGKKSSIQFGVERAENENILMLDADVIPQKDWLISMLTDLQHADLVLGSVINTNQSHSLLSLIQDSEALMLEGIKTASINNSMPLLASGANLGFKKSRFLNSNPFADNLNIPSGDDMFLLQVAKNESWNIVSNSSTFVETKGAKDFKSSLKQHRRWAAKTPKLKNTALNVFGSIMVLAQFSFIIGLVLFIFNHNSIIVLSLIIKFLVEFIFLFSRAIIFNRLKLLFFAPVMSICYPFYLMAIIIGLNKDKTYW